MKIGKKFALKYRRKREVKTDYRKRLSLIQSGHVRLVVRRMLNNITVQLVQYTPTGDKTLVTVHSRRLLKFGWQSHRGNTPSAYLTGFLAGLEGKKQGIKNAVLDLGLVEAVKGSVIFAAVKGVVDAGIAVPHSPDILPSDDRIQGITIASYAKKSLKAANLPQHFTETKQKIQQQWK